jgi:hypothetical protein
LGTFALTGLWRLLNSVARLLNVHAQSGHIAAQLRIDLIAVRVGSLGDDCVDARRAWTKQREIGPEGAVLVRPDRYIGFRSAGVHVHNAGVLEDRPNRRIVGRDSGIAVEADGRKNLGSQEGGEYGAKAAGLR